MRRGGGVELNFLELPVAFPRFTFIYFSSARTTKLTSNPRLCSACPRPLDVPPLPHLPSLRTSSHPFNRRARRGRVASSRRSRSYSLHRPHLQDLNHQGRKHAYLARLPALVRSFPDLSSSLRAAEAHRPLPPTETTSSTPLLLDSPTFTPSLHLLPLRYRHPKSCVSQQTSPLFDRARTERPSRTLERKSTFRSGTSNVDSLLLRRRLRSRKLGTRRGSWARREERTR